MNTYVKRINSRLFRIGIGIVLCLGASNQLKADYYVCAGNQASGRYEVYNPNTTDWDNPAALIWAFAPTTGGGWTSTEVAAYSNPSDMKLAMDGSTEVVVSCASGGLATIATYPGGSMVWTLNIGGSDNLHSVDLLPNGNIAVAAADGNYVRIYASSQGNRNSTHAQFNLTAAHAALYDPVRNTVWALGDTLLTELSVGGTAASPTLTEVYSVSLPASGGHDLSWRSNPNQIWVTTSLNAWIFTISSGTFSGAPGGANRTAVKGCGNQPSGEIVQCQIDNSECTLNTWCTPHVDFFTPLGVLDYECTKTGAAFYKSRVFCLPGYDMPGPAACSMNSNLISVIWPGYDSRIYLKTWTPSAGWVDQGPIQSGSSYDTPAIVSRRDGIVDAFVRGPDNALWQSHYETNYWGPWTSLGGVLLSGPSACSPNTNQWTVVYRNYTNAIGYLTWSNGNISFGVWGGETVDRPCIVSMTPNTMSVFEHAVVNNGLWEKDLPSTNWINLGGLLSSGPSAVSKNTNNITVIWRDENDTLNSSSKDSDVWSYTPLGYVSQSSTTIVTLKNSNTANAYYLAPGDNFDGLYNSSGTNWGAPYSLGAYY
jgi:hypothetical protein